jgi:pimeloyl-ACP methyl ester carboxylesterase
MIAYDEFGLFQDNAREAGLPWDGAPAVRRQDVEVAPGQRVSALCWGTAAPDLVLIHGGAQNAHTWDTVALALGRPLVAVDLPGHGHSDWKADGAYHPRELANDVAVALDALAPDARAVVGMSMGGLTSIALASARPDLVRRLALVDVTPGVNQEKGAAIAAFVSGPQSFASFDEILARTIEHNPTRTESSLRRGVLHNAIEMPDGSWRWRYDRTRREEGRPFSVAELWDDLGRVTVPLVLYRGGISPVVDDDDVAELLRRRPHAEVVVVDGAGHSIQGDRPVELARLIDAFVPA